MATLPVQSSVPLFRRCAAARRAIKRGADPALTLSLALWPTEDVKAADEEAFWELMGEHVPEWMRSAA